MCNVSVIIPNYNHAPYLKQRVDSILNQTYQDFELIILDDCSKDNSKEIIEKYRNNSKISYIDYNEVNSGSTFNQWNRGIELSKGELIWIAESDDYSNSRFLEEILPYFANPMVTFAYCRSYDVDHNSDIIQVSYAHLDWCNTSFIKNGVQEVLDHLYLNCTIPNVSATLFRKSSFSPVYLDPSFKLTGDWFFYVNILATGKIGYLCTPLNYHRFHLNNVRSKEDKKMSTVLERFKILQFIKLKYNISIKKHDEAIINIINLSVYNSTFFDIFSFRYISFIASLCQNSLKFYYLFILRVAGKFRHSLLKGMTLSR